MKCVYVWVLLTISVWGGIIDMDEDLMTENIRAMADIEEQGSCS